MSTVKASKCHAEFKITGATLHPDSVTKQLDVTPSVSWSNQLDVSESGWMLSSRGHLISKWSEDHIVWLLAQLSNFAEHFDSFKEKNFQFKLSAKCFTYGAWEIASHCHVISSDLTDRLRWMLDLFESKEESLILLKEQFEGLTLNYHVRCAIKTFNTTLFFDETLVSRLAKSNVNLNVLVCFK